MDRNKVIALALISALFFAFSYFNTQQQERYAAQKSVVESKVVEREIESEEAALATMPEYGEQRAAVAPEPSVEQIVRMENDQIVIDFTTRGGIAKMVELKEFTRYAPKGERDELVKLFDPESARMSLTFYIRSGLNNVMVNTMERDFVALPIVEVDGGEQLTMSLPFEGGGSLDYIYTLYASDDAARNYMVDFKIRLRDMAPIMANQSSLILDWSNRSYQNEKGFANENTYTTVAYHFAGESSIEELAMGTESKSESVSTAVDWVAFKQQFFTSALISPTSQITTSELRYATAVPNSGYIKDFGAKLTLPLTPASSEYQMALYYGPNKFATLQSINDLGYGELKMEEIVPLGWGIFGWVNRWFVIPVFDLLREHIASFGVIILILSILVKLIISPMTYSSYVSMAKMRVIKPQVDQIAAKYPKSEDAAKKQQATMELYRKTGINPLGGCIPMLIQMPIIIAMFRFFPASIELRGESFLWADDLSSYDSVMSLPFEVPFYGDHVSLFALLMTVVLFFYSLMNYNQSSSSQPQMAGMKFMMVYMMPVMMLLWFNSYSSGLCYYYFLANLLTIAQTLMIRKMVDDDKILATLNANSAKNKDKKKSRFQLRYEEMLAQQESSNKTKK